MKQSLLHYINYPRYMVYHFLYTEKHYGNTQKLVKGYNAQNKNTYNSRIQETLYNYQQSHFRWYLVIFVKLLHI